MIDPLLQEEADTVGHVPEIEDRVQVPEIGEGKTRVVRNKNGNSKLRLSLKVLHQIQIALVVMLRQFIINIRYS